MNKISQQSLLVSVIILLSFSLAKGQNIGVNATGNTPDASAMLDVSSSNSGVLIPRVALTTSASASPITSPATSLMIYNTATAGDVTPGFYYWDGAAWIRLATGSGSAGSGVTSVTATVPVYASGASTPDISLQGTAGTICYGTGGGSSFTAVGTAGQFLKSTGASAPVFAGIGQTSTTVYQTTNITPSSLTWTQIPGLTQTFVASNSNYLISTSGSMQCSTTTINDNVNSQIIILINFTTLSSGGKQFISARNGGTTAVYGYGVWSINESIVLTAGTTYTIAVYANKAAGSSTTSNPSFSSAQGTLTITQLAK
jgi:hypothetical protein